MITYPNSLLNFNDEKLTFQLQVNQKLLYNDLKVDSLKANSLGVSIK